MKTAVAHIKVTACTILGRNTLSHSISMLCSDVGDLGKLVADSDGGLPDTWVNDTALSLFFMDGITGRSMAVSVLNFLDTPPAGMILTNAQVLIHDFAKCTSS